MRAIVVAMLMMGGCQFLLESLDEVGNCGDLIDNDNNGLIDCADAVCASDPVCDPAFLLNCSVVGTLNLNQQSCSGRATPDAVSFAVDTGVAPGSTTLSLPSTAGLSAGDVVLLIDLQGNQGSVADVGKFELLSLASVASNEIVFASPVQQNYPVTDQIMLQRVPQYNTVTLTPGSVLTADTWDGERGGLLALRAATVILDGTIDMSGRGYRGGLRPSNTFEPGFQGESLDRALGQQNLDAGFGGGAGGGENQCGQGNGTAGAGGGYGTNGANSTVANCAIGGRTYGVADLSLLFLGSGGGSGGNDNLLSDNPIGGAGGPGGGIIFLSVGAIIPGSTGAIHADGINGQGDAAPGCIGNSTVDCFDFSGAGGGGAGGSIRISGDSTGVTATANGGNGGLGGASSGGTGGSGIIFR